MSSREFRQGGSKTVQDSEDDSIEDVSVVELSLSDSDQDDSNIDPLYTADDSTANSNSDESTFDEESEKSDDGSSDDGNNDNDTDWGILTNDPKIFRFRSPPQAALHPRENTPIAFFELFLTNKLLNTMVVATNKNGEQLKNSRLTRHSRFKKWIPITKATLKKFIGLLLYMGVVNYPALWMYWSKKPLYNNPLVRNSMSRNIFQLILRLWHFNKNERADDPNRLKKLTPLVLSLNKSFKLRRKLGQNCVIDESMIPFRGKLNFRQYIPGKSHKYGVKIFKLCDPMGYTYSFCIYAGKNMAQQNMKTDDLVMKLMTPYLNRGRLLVVDNFYTSVPLAERLLTKKTYILGTVRSNRRRIPKIQLKDLERGDLVAYENKNKVVFMAWRDKRLVQMLSTKFRLDLRAIKKKRQ
ncbi:piggyBac transposable element-derived protein 4-like [Planococcus citri]|uniref:piggyBac transposable element-derived protein 4-like n=1 Tax=Planococcus citri TaxID=170843 RepID=UPI0031F86348